ncbi:hypothetical protein [Hydrogenophaga defluvii]|uniref:Topoisomerase 6 subunit A/Spo11 TOPRIM domain-containing protein n=1 Tax=Hydrogenophaga defluvii TaxID=249410 RepID=A0ABW2SCI4_9BURK
MFEREDWTLFRNIGTLGQKAGVPVRQLASLVAKELTDNALDAGANVTVRYESGWVLIEDDGPGLPCDPGALARLFSIRRPLTSSKLVRVPLRGALGNGLRVVTGAVLASGGKLYVETHDRRFHLSPKDDGTTGVSSEPCERPTGTLVAVKLGPSVPVDPKDVLTWATQAIELAPHGKSYRGKTSPWWYDSESFFEMLQAAGARPLCDVLVQFRDVSVSTAHHFGQGLAANAMSRADSNHLLQALREVSEQPKPGILGKLGDVFQDFAHAHEGGVIEILGTGMPAQMPYSIDAYVAHGEDDEGDTCSFFVNRTPITGQMSVQRQKSHELGIIGCGLRHLVDVGRKPISLICNITTPYMPITTDGKEPDLHRYLQPLYLAITKAAKKAKRQSAQVNGRRQTQREVIEGNLRGAIDKASGNNRYRYSLRQLFYAVRPFMLDAFGKEPDYNYFAQVITDIEAAAGEDLPGLYRDARGIIYHPHTGQEIPLGTLNVEKYDRPEWTFNKVLYSEKEGFFSILKDTGWPERNDCALLTSKGFASRAARDVIDLMGQTQEEIYFFCIHDADASGTLIYQALTEATRARGARKVHVINLGLDPWEAVDMDLQVERFRAENASSKRGERRLPVADYVPQQWEEWLQSQRVELNAMSSPQFIEWLDGKFEQYSDKVVPPSPVLSDAFGQATQASVKRMLAARILEEAGFDQKVEALVREARTQATALDLNQIVRQGLKTAPQARWDHPLEVQADALARHVLRG